MAKNNAAAGAPMWMVTFADLMALLLTLFVLLLTFSEMDAIRFKSIVGSMKSAFGFTREVREQGIVQQEGTLIGEFLRDATPEAPRITMPIPEPQPATVGAEAAVSREEAAEKLAAALQDTFDKIAAASEVEVQRNGGDVVVRFPNRIAFPSGSAGIDDEFAAILNRVAPVLAQVKGDVLVAGHTDDVPIRQGSRYRSNWDLSAARATSVVHWFINRNNLPLERFTVQGFADSRPLVPNDSDENRATNRRVELVIQVEVDKNAADRAADDAFVAPASGVAPRTAPAPSTPAPATPATPSPSGAFVPPSLR